MRSSAQLGALIFGIVFLLVGILGLFVPNGMAMEADMETAGRLLGLFPVNLLHNIVHLAFGAWGIAASRSHPASRSYGRIGAIIYALLVVLAFLSPSMFGLVPIGGNDIWLHAILALGLAYIGFAGGDARTVDTARTADTV
jgi:DMSO/TMAO reductase YedYZ heme-binding membrane subunit